MKKKVFFAAALLVALLLCAGCLSTGGTSGQTTPTLVTPTVNLLPDGSVVTGNMPVIYHENTAPNQQLPTAAPVEQTTVPSTAWIVDIYNTVYNTTKADPTFVGNDEILISDITVDGIKNSAVDSIVYSVLDMIYNPRTLPLPPYSETNPFPTSIFTAADAAQAEWTDLGNGTASIRIVPHPSVNSGLGEGQGKMFNVINDIRPIFDALSAFSFRWSEGNVDSNVTVTYDGGYCEVTYDRTTMKMISAKYVMDLEIAVKNINILFGNHNAEVDITYTQTFPTPLA